MTHRSRLCHVVIDCADRDEAVGFWSAALDAIEEPVNAGSRHVYRRLTLPDNTLRLLLHHTEDSKTEKSRIHLDIESDNVLAEVQRLEDLGARRVSNQTERGYNFWVMQDPSQNEFCVLQAVFPDLLAATDPRTY